MILELHVSELEQRVFNAEEAVEGQDVDEVNAEVAVNKGPRHCARVVLEVSWEK
jgi:hypothetical protein